MELGDYIRAIRRHWMIVVALVLSGLIASGMMSLFTPPTYTARAQLFVSTQSSGTVAELQQGNSFSQARVQSYVKTATTPEVLQPAIEMLGIDAVPAELSPKISASADANTVLISISAQDESPIHAAALAQAVAVSLISAVDRLETPTQGGSSPVKLSVVTPAVAPSAPSAPNMKLNLLSGLAIGAVLGIGWALFRTRFDTKIRSEEDLKRITDAAVLGGIAYDNDAQKKPLLTQAAHQSPRAESFRQIRTNLQFANIDSTSNTLLITSSLPGEGKSTTATNLAIALAEAGQRVVLVDADLRRPMVATYLGLEGSAGLTTALVTSTPVENLLQPWGVNELFVLTSGSIPPNPSELLGSAAMTDLLLELSTSFDAVILDAPPLIPVTDAAVLAEKVGNVALVLGTSKIRNQDLVKSLAALRLVDAKVRGVILNLLPTKGPDAYAYTYYSYHSDQKPQGSRKGSRKNLSGSHLRSTKRSVSHSSEYQDSVN